MEPKVITDKFVPMHACGTNLLPLLAADDGHTLVIVLPTISWN